MNISKHLILVVFFAYLTGCGWFWSFKPKSGSPFGNALLGAQGRGDLVRQEDYGSFQVYKFVPKGLGKVFGEPQTGLYYVKNDVLYSEDDARKIKAEEEIKRQEDNIRKAQEIEEKSKEQAQHVIDVQKKKDFLNGKVDVVSKVLNYSTGCSDDGCESGSWYAEDQANCVYRYKIFDEKTRSGSRFFGMPEHESELKLNELDPNYIRLTRDAVYMMGSAIRLIKVIANDRVIFASYEDRVDMDRLRNGWSLIYRDYCIGRQREF